MIHCVVNAVCRNFSRSINNNEWKLFDNGLFSKFLEYFDSLFYANGNSIENEGYLSIIFDHCDKHLPYQLWKNTEVRGEVSVVDVAQNKRFSQSFVFVSDNINSSDLEGGFFFGLERYLKRETLLNDPSELLPGDCLTVCVEVDLIDHSSDHISQEKIYIKENPFCRDEEGRLWIFLDTGFGKDLCRVSKYFRCASDTPMIESRTRKVRIQKDEEILFMRIFHILKGFGDMWLRSVEEIFDLYHAANKYDIQLLVETCRQFVRTILRSAKNPKYREYVDEYIPGFLELADYYSDDEIKDAVKIYLEIKDNFGTDDYAFEQYLKEKLYTEWMGEFMVQHTSIPPSFIMNRRIVEPKFEFYQ